MVTTFFWLLSEKYTTAVCMQETGAQMCVNKLNHTVKCAKKQYTIYDTNYKDNNLTMT